MRKNIKTKIIACLLVFLLIMTATSCTKKEIEVQKPVIGVAWRSDQNSESFVATCQAIEAAGGTARILNQVLSYDLNYNDNQLIEGKSKDGSLIKRSSKNGEDQYMAKLEC